MYLYIKSYTEEILTFSSELKVFLKIFKLKMFLICSNQVKLAVFMFTVYLNKLKLLNKLNLTFLFSLFRSNIENIETKMYLHGFQERMFSIQEQCSWIFLSVYLK